MKESEGLQNIARQELTRAVYSFLSAPHRDVTRRKYPELKSDSSHLTKPCSRFAIKSMIKYPNWHKKHYKVGSYMASYLHFNSGHEKNEYENIEQSTIATIPKKFSHSVGSFIITFE